MNRPLSIMGMTALVLLTAVTSNAGPLKRSQKVSLDLEAVPVATVVPPTAPVEPTGVPQPTERLGPSATPTLAEVPGVAPTAEITEKPKVTATPVPFDTAEPGRVDLTLHPLLDRLASQGHQIGQWRKQEEIAQRTQTSHCRRVAHTRSLRRAAPKGTQRTGSGCHK